MASEPPVLQQASRELSSANVLCKTEKKKPDAQLDKTYSVYVCQTHIHWAGQHMSLLLFNSLTTSHAALCHCCYVEKSQKVKGQLHTLLPLSNIQPALSWSRTCPNRDWLLSSFFFFSPIYIILLLFTCLFFGPCKGPKQRDRHSIVVEQM